MKKLKALLIALCLISALLILNAPDINYGRGPDDIYEPDYHSALSSAYDDALSDNHKDINE